MKGATRHGQRAVAPCLALGPRQADYRWAQVAPERAKVGCFLWKQLGGDSRHRHTQNIAGPPAAKTAAALGFGFIGIDTSGWVREVEHRFPDFSDLAAFIKTLQSLQANLSPKPRP